MSRFGSRTAGICALACTAVCALAGLPGTLADGPTVQTNERGAAGLAGGEPVSDSAVDLRPVLDAWGLSARSQGSRGTCSAFTVTQAIEYALWRNEQRTARLSVEFLNWASNEAIGEKSDGGFFSDLWKGFEQYGICAEDQMPYAAAYDPDYRPSRAALDNARQLLAGGLRLHWIKPWDPNVGLNDEQFDAVKETLRRALACLRRLSVAETGRVGERRPARWLRATTCTTGTASCWSASATTPRSLAAESFWCKTPVTDRVMPR